jgi:hypothetical protein
MPSSKSEKPSDPTDADEVKRSFKAALDRKRAGSAGRASDDGGGSSKVHEAHGPAKNQRTFRRKSGG